MVGSHRRHCPFIISSFFVGVNGVFHFAVKYLETAAIEANAASISAIFAGVVDILFVLVCVVSDELIEYLYEVMSHCVGYLYHFSSPFFAAVAAREVKGRSALRARNTDRAHPLTA